MQDFKYISIRFLLFIWQLPQALLGLIILSFLKEKTIVAQRHHNTCYISPYFQGGISLGPIAIMGSYFKDKPADIAHEIDGHTVQSKILGWFYLPSVGLCSLLHAWLYDRKKSCYYDYWTEKWANRCAGVNVNEKCKLYLKEN